MKTYRTLLEKIKEIATLSAKENVSPEKLALLWKKLYLYEHAHPDIIAKRSEQSTDVEEFWKYDDAAKRAPIYYLNAQYHLQVTKEKGDYSAHDFSTEKERLEYYIRQAIKLATEELAKDDVFYQSSSLYHYCKICSLAISKFLWSHNYFCRMISVQDFFSPDVPHMLCIVETEGTTPYIIDMTYTQFRTVALCMQEARFQYEDSWIGPGYFIDTSEKEELLLPLMENGFLACDKDAIKVYGDSFVLAQQSYGAKRLLLKPPKTKGTEYIERMLNSQMIRN